MLNTSIKSKTVAAQGSGTRKAMEALASQPHRGAQGCKETHRGAQGRTAHVGRTNPHRGAQVRGEEEASPVTSDGLSRACC